MIVTIILFIIGLALLAFCSSKTIDAAKHVGNRYNISPLAMGIIVLAIGTSLPEATGSITASVLGHGNIVIGDIIGSALIQITFIIGVIALVNPLKGNREEILLIGGCAIIASIMAVMVTQKGFITRWDAVLLLITLGIFLYINHIFCKKSFQVKSVKDGAKYIGILIISLIGVIIGAGLTVTSAIELSRIFGIPEFFIAFLIIGPGGSIPELAVSLAALKKNELQLSIGNLLGSNMADLTFALGIGPLIAPIVVDAELATFTGRYLIFASLIVVGLFALRKKVDRKAALVFIALYILFVVLALLGLGNAH